MYGALLAFLLALDSATDPNLIGIYQVKVDEADQSMSSCLTCDADTIGPEIFCIRLSSSALVGGCWGGAPPLFKNSSLYSLQNEVMSTLVGCSPAACCNSGWAITRLFSVSQGDLEGIVIQEQGRVCGRNLVPSCSCVFPFRARRLTAEETWQMEEDFERLRRRRLQSAWSERERKQRPIPLRDEP
jgi:hypothetical protein